MNLVIHKTNLNFFQHDQFNQFENISILNKLSSSD